MFKKLVKKVSADVKEAVKEETAKTTEEIKSDVVSALKEAAPVIAAFVGALTLLLIAKKPTPVVVKVVVKQV